MNFWNFLGLPCKADYDALSSEITKTSYKTEMAVQHFSVPLQIRLDEQEKLLNVLQQQLAQLQQRTEDSFSSLRAVLMEEKERENLILHRHLDELRDLQAQMTQLFEVMKCVWLNDLSSSLDVVLQGNGT